MAIKIVNPKDGRIIEFDTVAELVEYQKLEKPAKAKLERPAKAIQKSGFGAKSAIIRDNPGLPAPRLIALASSHGIELTRDHIYNVRSEAKRKRVMNARISKGRQDVANGKRPKLVDAVATVIGSGAMSAPQVLKALKARKWDPEATNPQSYISFTLSANPTCFERVERGLYRVRGTRALPSALQLPKDRFGSNASLVALLPKELRTSINPKDARARIEKRVADFVKDLSPTKRAAFLRTIEAAKKGPGV